jgi:hypothetical protein
MKRGEEEFTQQFGIYVYIFIEIYESRLYKEEKCWVKIDFFFI